MGRGRLGGSMRANWRAGLVCVALGLGGCAGDGRDGFSLRNPFNTTEKPPEPPKGPPASTRAATRVIAVGSAVVARNKEEIGVTPVFFTLGVPEVEISHKKGGMVVLSEGLVDRCTTDEQLAAVICHELGKLAAEQPVDRPGDREPPPAPRLTPDVVGGGFGPDMTRQAEEARYDRRGPRAARGGRDPGRDPRTLAEAFYVRAGNKAED